MIDELDFILHTARSLGLGWSTVDDIGSLMVRSIVPSLPVLNTEMELAVRLEDQRRAVSENDLRDLSAFSTVLPLADIVVAEKQFINLARQSHLDTLYNTTLLTSVYDLQTQTKLSGVGFFGGVLFPASKKIGLTTELAAQRPPRSPSAAAANTARIRPLASPPLARLCG